MAAVVITFIVNLVQAVGIVQTVGDPLPTIVIADANGR